MIDNKNAIALDNFRGLFDQGDDNSVPFDHFINTLNCIPKARGWGQREGSTLYKTLPSILRYQVYKRIGEAQRLIILTTDGNFYDSLDLITPILTIAAATDFSMVTMFNRAYITPHNRQKGISNEFIYVYSGSGSARKIAGVAPTGFTLGVTTSATGGFVEAGTHLFAVAYETDTGFVTIPGPEVYTEYTAPGDFQITVSNIPIGPAGTAARYIIGTKIIATYNGDQVNQAYYFIPGGYIEDNATTSIDLNFFDADLTASADYLFDQLAEVPASLGLSNYQGSLVTYGEYDYDSIIRVSKVGNPESHSSTEGYLPIDPGDGEGIKNCTEYRGNLVIFKSKRTYVTVSNGDAVAFWRAEVVDRAIGTEVFGVSQIFDARGATTDTLIIADRSGLLMYDGTFRMDLTDKIRNIWAQIDQLNFDKVQVFQDPTAQRIYINLPVGVYPVDMDYMLMGDYQLGLDKDNIRWYKWKFPQQPTCIGIMIQDDTELPVMLYGGTNIYYVNKDQYDYSDAGTTVTSYAKTAYLHFTGKGVPFRDYVNNFSDIRIRAFGHGPLTPTVHTLDYTLFSNLELPHRDLNLETTIHQWHCNVDSERLAITFTMGHYQGYYTISRVALFGNKLWVERPM